ncbi:MAG: HlyD family efflux transporter periplasmic adaptor subunit [Thermoanaerobaculia bacterium]
MTPGRRVAVVGGALVVALGLWRWAATGSGRTIARVTRGDLVLATEATGEIEAIDAEVVGPPNLPDVWEFKIQFLASEGKEVRRGQPLVAFDTSEQVRKLSIERAKADESEQKLAKTRADLERERLDAELRLAEAQATLRKATLKVDVPAELVARRELDSAHIDHDLAEKEVGHRENELAAIGDRLAAELAQLEHQLTLARGHVRELETAVAKMSIAAPRDGTVVYVSDWRGEKAKVGDPAYRSQEILSLPDLKRLRASAEIAEVDAGKVREGQLVRLRLDAHPDLEYRAHVARVERTVQRKAPNSPLRIVLAELELETVDSERMRPGMRFRAAIERERATAVLTIPVDAIVHRDGRTLVDRETLLGVEAVAPRLGRRGGGRVEVLEGLSEGDRVVRGGTTSEKERS